MKRVFVALLLAAVAFAALWQWSYAAVVAGHGTGGSGVPYASRGLCLRNDTYYVTEFSDAMSGWNNQLGGTWYQLEAGNCLDGHLTYANSQQDINWARWFSALSCQDVNNRYPEAYNSRAFEYGHNGPYFNDSRYIVVCLNVASDMPKKFQDAGVPRVIGLEHELGHGLHLAHDTNGVMNMCWCYGIQADEGTAIGWTYASPP
ncbi:MAG: hypothetical protein ACYDCT_06560 [Dehalococcoidia bacterium]